LDDLPAGGREFSFSGQELFEGFWREYGLAYRPGRPLAATLAVTPQEGGVRIVGGLTGSVVVPCDRCTGDAEIGFDVELDLYEEAVEPSIEDPEPLLSSADGHLKLNAGRLLWEQFNLALPVKVLCRKDCKGLCPGCGRDLNVEACTCEKDEGDPRLAALRGLKLKQ
jgi:uncharacterized protein